MLPSDMNMNIKTETVTYNNKILVSDGKFSLEKNDKVNALEPTPKISQKIKSRKVLAQMTSTHAQKPTITPEDEKIALMLSLTAAFMIWYMFQ